VICPGTTCKIQCERKTACYGLILEAESGATFEVYDGNNALLQPDEYASNEYTQYIITSLDELDTVPEDPWASSLSGVAEQAEGECSDMAFDDYDTNGDNNLYKQSISADDYEGAVCCRADTSAGESTIVGTSEDQPVQCGGRKACYGAEIDVQSSVLCTGLLSCGDDSEPKGYFQTEQAVYCSAYMTCLRNQISAPVVYCSGYESCSSSTITYTGDFTLYVTARQRFLKINCPAEATCTVFCSDSDYECEDIEEIGSGNVNLIYDLSAPTTPSPTANPTTTTPSPTTTTTPSPTTTTTPSPTSTTTPSPTSTTTPSPTTTTTPSPTTTTTSTTDPTTAVPTSEPTSPSPTANPTTGYHYVVAGNPYNDDLQSNVVASCEEDSSNQGHYESGTWGFDLHVACCDEEQGSRPGCVSKATYQEAFDHCDSLGLRLCTAMEVVTEKTKGAGCQFDRSYAWTSTECSVDGVPLTDEGNPSAGCGCLDECAGDCDSDADCVGDLVCFHRGSGDGIPPGCFGQPHYSSHDYCYDPAKADASGDPARSIERQQDSGYDVIESGEQVMNDAAEDSHLMAVLLASLAVVAVMAIAVVLYCVLRKKEVKVEEEKKTVDGHVPSSSIEMSDAPRPTAPISV